MSIKMGLLSLMRNQELALLSNWLKIAELKYEKIEI